MAELFEAIALEATYQLDCQRHDEQGCFHLSRMDWWAMVKNQAWVSRVSLNQ